MSPVRRLRRQLPWIEVGVLAALVLACAGFGSLAAGAGLGADAGAEAAGRFGRGELLGWGVLALATGGLGLGAKDRTPALVASGLVGSAALLGADAVTCAIIGALGGIGGLRRNRDLAVPRVLGAALLGWAIPGVLVASARLGGPSLEKLEPTLAVASLVALWAAFVLVVPVMESLVTRVALPPQEAIDPVHMVLRRLEPQSVLAALAVLAAITYAAVGPAAALIVLLPGAAAGVGFKLHDEGLRAVSQTLAAMTILPEWVGIVDAGHTERVRDVVERVCIDLELESRIRRDVVRAAELHELGHLDGGVVSGDRGRIARSGAAVLEQAAVQDRVVRIVHATDPERLVAARDADVELGAAIVATACELDRMGAMHDVSEAAARVQVALGRAQRSAGAFL